MIIVPDWDGTLVDSANQIVAATQAAADICGLEGRESDAIRHIIGLGLPEAIQALYPGIEPLLVEQMRDTYSRCYRDAGVEPAAFFPGVLKSLQSFLIQGYQLAVATGKSRRGQDRELQVRKLNTLFHVTRCADETFSKPHPRMLQEILHQAEKKPDQALMVGDTVFDMEMADRAGIKKVAVTMGRIQKRHCVPAGRIC